jgi:hypothetical protein
VPFFDILSGLAADRQDTTAGCISQLKRWQKQFVEASIPIEQQQQSAWYRAIVNSMKQQQISCPETVFYEAQIVARAREVLSHHRFAFAGGTTHVARIAVTGPGNSGRSTFLTIITQQLLIDLLASGDWKETFVFPINMSLIVDLLTDIGALYQAMVQLTFHALSAQYPLVLPHTAGLIAAFESVLTGKPLLPKGFVLSEDFHPLVADLRQLLNVIGSCWRDKEGLEPFLITVFKLPIMVADIFGFAKYFFVVDHIDLADTMLSPTLPFEEGCNVFVLECVKCAMESTSFLVSGKKPNAITNLFASLSEVGVDLTERLHVISTLDVVPTEAVNSEKEFNVNFEGDAPRFTLKAGHFGGCAVFLKAWDELMMWAHRIDEVTHSQGDVDEPKAFLNTTVERIIRQLFVGGDGQPRTLAVKSVTRIDGKAR